MRIEAFILQWSVGLRLVEPTPRREYWSTGLLDFWKMGKYRPKAVLTGVVRDLVIVYHPANPPEANHCSNIPLFHSVGIENRLQQQRDYGLKKSQTAEQQLWS